MYKKLSHLTEVKKGETGCGLLIENDGHITGNKDMIQQIKEDIAHHDKFVIPDKFTVNAVFQKFGIKNANGRVYPENILKREVEKYIQTRVNNRAAVGALDHPECQLPDTRILTEEGWKFITDVKKGESILTIKKNGIIEKHNIIRTIESPYQGELINLSNENINITVTPNHRFPIFNQYGILKGYYTASKILEHQVPNFKDSYIGKVGSWVGKKIEYNIIPKIENDTLVNLNISKDFELYTHNIILPVSIWCNFIGLCVSNACTYNEDKLYVSFIDNNKNLTKINDTRDLLSKITNLFEEVKENIYHTFIINDLRVNEYVKEFTQTNNKFIPLELKELSKYLLFYFYDWYLLGNNETYLVSSEKLALDINEIQMKMGYNGVFNQIDNNYTSHQCFTKYIKLSDLKITTQEYDGNVYCVEVENHNFYTMCNNGHCFWSGNSSTLSGHDVSHVITSLEWKGRTLVGTMDLHLSPGYKKYGIISTSGDKAANMLLDDILIGVSSRGVGSVQDRLGVLEVGDDFELISWDIVLEPSTPNAYIGKNIQDLVQYIESNETKNDKSLMNEKIEKIKKILL